MAVGSLLAEAVVQSLLENPDVGVLVLLGLGGFYELHYGTVAEMSRNQFVMAVAIYRLLQSHPDLDEGGFREDIWGDENGATFPGDWDQPPEPSEQEVDPQ